MKYMYFYLFLLFPIIVSSQTYYLSDGNIYLYEKDINKEKYFLTSKEELKKDKDSPIILYSYKKITLRLNSKFDAEKIKVNLKRHKRLTNGSYNIEQNKEYIEIYNANNKILSQVIYYYDNGVIRDLLFNPSDHKISLEKLITDNDIINIKNIDLSSKKIKDDPNLENLENKDILDN